MRRLINIFLTALALVMLNAGFGQAQSAERNTAVRFIREGMERLHQKSYDAAADAFREAISYDDENGAGHLGLGIAYSQLHEDSAALRELERAADLLPEDPVAYQVMGDLHYRRDELEDAVSSWQKAADLKPDDAGIKARLERLKKELGTEKDFSHEATGHFLTKYEGREQKETGRIVIKILEDAYGAVGRELSYYPDDEIQVILYSEQQFRDVTDAPGWSGGIYDGKIRLPIGGVSGATAGLRRLLYHEYTHVVVSELAPHCPTWLHEGLAQYFEGSSTGPHGTALLKQLARRGAVPALKNLEGSFSGFGPEQAHAAYLLSRSAVKYLVDSFGMYRVRSILDSLGAGASIESAVSDGIMISYAEFDRNWKRSLE